MGGIVVHYSDHHFNTRDPHFMHQMRKGKKGAKVLQPTDHLVRILPFLAMISLLVQSVSAFWHLFLTRFGNKMAKRCKMFLKIQSRGLPAFRCYSKMVVNSLEKYNFSWFDLKIYRQSSVKTPPSKSTSSMYVCMYLFTIS